MVRETPLYLACSPHTAADTPATLSGALDGMKKDGAFNRIMGQHEGK